MRNKKKKSKIISPTLHHSQAQLHSWLLCFLPLSSSEWWGVEAAVSSLCVLSVTPSSLSSSAPAWVPTHRTQSSTNLSNVNPSHKPQFFQSCSIMGPFHGDQSFRTTLFQFGSPPRITSLAIKPAPVWVPLQRLQFLSGHIHMLPCEVFHGLQVDICFTRDLQGCRGIACLTMVLTMGCRESLLQSLEHWLLLHIVSLIHSHSSSCYCAAVFSLSQIWHHRGAGLHTLTTVRAQP